MIDSIQKQLDYHFTNYNQCSVNYLDKIKLLPKRRIYREESTRNCRLNYHFDDTKIKKQKFSEQNFEKKNLFAK